VHFRFYIRPENDLSQPLAVTQIDEYDATVVAALGHPPHEDDFFTNILGSKFIAMVGAFPPV
jgi:hypothetical protein